MVQIGAHLVAYRLICHCAALMDVAVVCQLGEIFQEDVLFLAEVTNFVVEDVHSRSGFSEKTHLLLHKLLKRFSGVF